MIEPSEAAAFPDGYSVRRANPDDSATIRGLILELARYEKLEHELVATVQDLRETIFAPGSPVRVMLVENGESTSVAYSLCFRSYSTFLGRPGVYLEDLFVMPEFRGRGIGKALLATVARDCLEQGGGRLEWSVLNWNEPAIRFYESLGAGPMSEWTTYRLTAAPLKKLAGLPGA